MGSAETTHRKEGSEAMPIAIVGIGCRLPGGATDTEKFWKLMMDKKSARKEVPADRFNVDAFYHPDGDKNGTINSRAGHFLDEDIQAFDAPFFSISPAEALSMDPMQRILLEVAYEATENAGIPIASLAGSNTGAFVGCFTSDYDQIAKRDAELLPKYHSVGTGQAILSNRLSYCFDLRGPSFTLDTACSSSLVALHLACQSLRAGESSTAIVGATNAILNPDIMVGMTNLHFLSPDSISYAFDARANGYARGEGMAALVLKPMDDAIRDGDTIRAVIRGTSVNSNGRGPGITVPSREAQASLIRTAYEQAGCDPAQTMYCEAHGTGTQAGDPLEAGAIGDVFGPLRPNGENGKLYIGSVKTNIGHLEGASGLAGVIKAVLSLEKGIIAPNLWFEKGNPKIDFEGLRIRVPTETVEWPTPGVRRASVNGFGYGGTNGHVVLDDAYHFMLERGIRGNHKTSVPAANGVPPMEPLDPSPSEPSSRSPYRVFQISAREGSSVVSSAQAYADHLESSGSESETRLLDNLAFTLNERRSKFEFANSVVASSKKALIEGLRSITDAIAVSPDEQKLGFIFTGQGAQWWAMGRELMQYPVFAQSMAECSKAIEPFSPTWSLFDEFHKDKTASRVGEAEISQPLCSALQISLVDLLESWDILPSRVVGHSSGEIGAAYATGALTLQDAMRAAFFRGLLSSKVKAMGYKGGMMAVGLPEQEALDELRSVDTKLGRVVVACVNSPKNVTISGDVEALSELQKSLTSRGVFARKLQVDTAYHSHHMLALAEEYLQTLGELKAVDFNQRKSVSMYSSVTGRIVTAGDDLGGKYWVDNMVSCVRFSDALAAMCEADGVDALVEVGPHAALAGPVKHILANLGKPGQEAVPTIKYVSALIRGKDASHAALEAAASLSNLGYRVDLHKANFLEGASTPVLSVINDLPTYSWNHARKYWDESRISRDYRFRAAPRTDLLGAPFRDWNPMEPHWRNFIRLSEQPWVRSHVVQGSIVYPAAGYCAMALEAAAQLYSLAQKAGNAPERQVADYIIRDLDISRALVVPETDEGVEVILSMQSNPVSGPKASSQGSEFRIFSYTAADGWAEHCNGLLSVSYVEDLGVSSLVSQERRESLKKSQVACTKAMSSALLYEGLDAIGLSYGPDFQGITNATAGPDQLFGTVQVTDTAKEMPMGFQFGHLIHPSTLDVFLQMSIVALSQGDMSNLQQAYVPTWIQELRLSGNILLSAGSKLQAAASAHKHGFREVHADVMAVVEGAEDAAVSLEGIKLSAIASSTKGNDSAEIPSHTSVAIWEPEVDLLSCERLNQILRDAIPPIRTRPKDYELLAYVYFNRVLDEIKESEVSGMHPHHQKFYQYMQHQRDLVMANEHELQTEDWKRLDDPAVQKRLEDLKKELTVESNLEGRMFTRMGEALVSVLRKEVEPLALMMQDDLLNRYYSVTVAMDGTYPQVARYVELLSHKNPDLEYIEIGAGTGGCTGPVLDALSGTGIRKYPRMKSYTYTDVSSGFFEQAAKKFSAWSDHINYQKLDIESDPATQPGFKDKQFDVVIAANVLHATSDISRTMEHTRKLLRPGGKLILLDMTHSVGSLSLIFGNLPGWWNCNEPWRQYGPLLNEEQWRDVLLEQSFTDFQANSPDALDPLEEQTRVMIATAVEKTPETVSDAALSKALLMVNDKSSASIDMANAVASALAAAGVASESCTVEESAGRQVTNTAIISFAELDEALLASITPSELSALQRALDQSAGTIWVTRGGVATKGTRPELAVFHGLARSLRAEREDKPCITFDLDPAQSLPEGEVAGMVTRLFQQVFRAGKGRVVVDRELSEESGDVRIKRVVENTRLNQLIASEVRSTSVDAVPQDIWDSPRPLELRVKSDGSLVFDDGAVLAGPLASDHVEIQVRAVGLNHRDLQASLGEISDDVLGVECAGVVTKVGGAISHVAVGDRVAAWTPKALATAVSTHGSFVHKIPDMMPFTTAAALPVAFVTAHYSLESIARIRKGDTVLVSSAASTVGQAAVQIATLHGARALAVVEDEESKGRLAEKFGIPASQVLLATDSALSKGVRELTSGRGVDVVISNSLAGRTNNVLKKILAPFGRFIEIGRGKLESGNAPSGRNVVSAIVDVAELRQDDPATAATVFSDAMKAACESKWEQPVFEPVVSPFSAISESLRSLKDGYAGSLVLEPRPNDLVPVMPKPLRHIEFPSDASYILSGGLGGIGRSVARWMARKGARNLIFVSRSGAKGIHATDLIDELQGRGVRAEVVKCDITDEAKLTRSLADVLKTMPPLRGVIQAAMNLQDQIFANMSYDAFNSCVSPKVQGSWNLHKATLEHSLDFFVMLASCTSHWGNAGQSNYAAGCTYQASLAAHRRSQGMPATSIDVGKVSNIGFIAENAGTQSELNLVKLGLVDQNEQEVLALLELGMMPPDHDKMEPGHGGSIPNGHLLTGQSSSMDPLKGDELPFWARDPVFSHMDFVRPHLRKVKKSDGEDDPAASRAQLPLSTLLASSESSEQAEQYVLEALQRKLARALMMPAQDVDVRKQMSAYGVDSLIAVDLRNWFSREADVDVAVFDIVQAPSVAGLASKVASKSSFVKVS